MIAALIKTWLAPYETYLWAALAVALTIAGAYFVHHERVIGEQKVIAADAAAQVKIAALVKTQEIALQVEADKAESYRDASQKAVNDYMSAHDVGSVLVCDNPRRGSSGLSKAAAPVAGSVNPGAGPAPVPEVPGRSASRDIGPALDTIVRAAAAMDGLYQQTQGDYLNAQRQR